MRRVTTLGGPVALATLLLITTGCGGPPKNNPLVDDAREAYEAAANDPQITANATNALDRAQEELRKAEALLREGEDSEDVEHYAYLAQQRVRIAEMVAARRAAEAEIERAEIERKEVLVEAREVEAELARQEAERQRLAAERQRLAALQAQEEAAQAKREAEEALAQARDLARQIDELQAKQSERGLVLTLGDVLFDVGEATLKPGGLRAVDKLAAFLNEYPERNVLIEGHTDNTGSDAFNQTLSEQRADAVREALLTRGIAGSRVQTRGYSEQYPVANNATSAGRQENRRVEVIISNDDGQVAERDEEQ